MFSLFMVTISLFWFCSYSEVVQVITVARHGSRTPLNKDRITFTEGGSQLQPLGFAECETSGNAFRERYFLDTSTHKIKDISSTYNMEQIWFRSTDTDRALTSGQSVAYGLFPLGTGPMLNTTTAALTSRLQSIAIHSTASSNDALLRSYTICPTHDSEVSSFLNSDIFYDKQVESQEMINIISNKIGKNFTLNDIWNVYDELNVELEHNETLWNIQYHLTTHEWNYIIDLAYWHEHNIYNTEMAISKLIGPFFTELSSRIKIKLNYSESSIGDYIPESKEFIWFSAHYPTIHSITSAFNLDEYYTEMNNIPTYASTISFEIHNDNNRIFIQFLTRKGDTISNNEPFYVYKLPFCSHVECPIDEFLTYIDSYKLSTLEFCQQCNNANEGTICSVNADIIREEYYNTVKQKAAIASIMLAISFLILGACISHCCWIRKIRKHSYDGVLRNGTRPASDETTLEDVFENELKDDDVELTEV